MNNSHKGVSRTLLKDFDSLESEGKSKYKNGMKNDNGLDNANTNIHRNYETRQRTSSANYRSDNRTIN